MIGTANWISTLGQFDIAYALNTLSHYCMAPRKGHFDFGHGKLVIDTGKPGVRKQAVISDGHNWVEFTQMHRSTYLITYLKL